MTIDERIADLKARVSAAKSLEELAEVERGIESLDNLPNTMRTSVRGYILNKIAVRAREILEAL